MALGLWEKSMFLLCGGLVVVIAVVIVACFVGPGCWGFEYLMRREKKKRSGEGGIENIPSLARKSIASHTCEPNWDFWMGNHDLAIYQTEADVVEEKGISTTAETPRYTPKEKMFNLRCTPLFMYRNLYPKFQKSFPRLKIKMVYSMLKNNDTMGRLSVHVLSATCLPTREYVSTLDPFVTLDISRYKWPFQRNTRSIHNVQTRVVRDNLNPNFDQTFTFDGMKQEVKNWFLKFTVNDHDRLTRLRPILEKFVSMRDVKNLESEGSVELNLDLQEAQNAIGTLLFGIRYMPTAQRLNINVIKAAKLKYQTHVPSLLEFCPYVRVVMLNGNGKCIKKKKTGFKQGEFSPIFNQSLIFDLSIESIEQTVFLVLLCNKSMNHISNGEDSSSADGDIEKSLRENKDKVLGMVVLGRNVKCPRARNHWVTVMQNPRKMISVWHDLK